VFDVVLSFHVGNGPPPIKELGLSPVFVSFLLSASFWASALTPRTERNTGSK
jgi:hypothetical protein